MWDLFYELQQRQDLLKSLPYRDARIYGQARYYALGWVLIAY
jgi:hypothetical protein